MGRRHASFFLMFSPEGYDDRYGPWLATAKKAWEAVDLLADEPTGEDAGKGKGLGEAGAGEGTEVKRTAAAVALTLLLILLFEFAVHGLPWIWLRDHQNSFGLQGGADGLISFFIFGLFRPKWRKVCWRMGALSLFVTIISLLGGRQT